MPDDEMHVLLLQTAPVLYCPLQPHSIQQYGTVSIKPSVDMFAYHLLQFIALACCFCSKSDSVFHGSASQTSSNRALSSATSWQPAPVLSYLQHKDKPLADA